MTDPTRVEIPTPAESERIVKVICAATDRPFQETWTLNEAAELLRAADYHVTPGTLMRLVSRGYVSDPPGGAWQAIHVHCAAAACESRRRWLPTPSRHDAKKSAARLQIESARQQGIEVFVDLDDHTLEDLLLQMASCDQRQIREVLFETVLAKMDVLGFIEE